MEEKQQAPVRNNVIHCEKCGEDYAATYKRCPFCDEKPGGGGIVSRRVNNTRGGGYGGNRVNPLQLVIVVLSLILIISALYIVFHTVAPLLGRGGAQNSGSQSQASASASQTLSPDGSVSGGDVSQPDSSGEPNTEEPSITGSTGVISGAASGLRLRSGPGTETSVLTTLPNGSSVTILEDTDDNWYKVSFSGSGRTVEGYVSKDYVTVSEPAPQDTPATPGTTTPGATTPGTTTPGTTTPGTATTGTAATGTTAGFSGVISGAASGLRVRSGPGTENEAIASLPNGASVTVLEDAGGGWYKISFIGPGGRSVEGYVSKDFVSTR